MSCQTLFNMQQLCLYPYIDLGHLEEMFTYAKIIGSGWSINGINPYS